MAAVKRTSYNIIVKVTPNFSVTGRSNQLFHKTNASTYQFLLDYACLPPSPTMSLLWNSGSRLFRRDRVQ